MDTKVLIASFVFSSCQAERYSTKWLVVSKMVSKGEKGGRGGQSFCDPSNDPGWPGGLLRFPVGMPVGMPARWFGCLSKHALAV